MKHLRLCSLCLALLLALAACSAPPETLLKDPEPEPEKAPGGPRVLPLGGDGGGAAG